MGKGPGGEMGAIDPNIYSPVGGPSPEQLALMEQMASSSTMPEFNDPFLDMAGGEGGGGYSPAAGAGPSGYGYGGEGYGPPEGWEPYLPPDIADSVPGGIPEDVMPTVTSPAAPLPLDVVQPNIDMDYLQRTGQLDKAPDRTPRFFDQGKADTLSSLLRGGTGGPMLDAYQPNINPNMGPATPTGASNG